MVFIRGKHHVCPLLGGVRSGFQNTLVLPYFPHDSFKVCVPLLLKFSFLPFSGFLSTYGDGSFERIYESSL
jgi:hypothetical protein